MTLDPRALGGSVSSRNVVAPGRAALGISARERRTSVAANTDSSHSVQR
jgi:hypothetical protein